jgi:hypothetical protein
VFLQLYMATRTAHYRTYITVPSAAFNCAWDTRGPNEQAQSI